MMRILHYMNSASQKIFRDKNSVALHDKMGHLYKSARVMRISSDEELIAKGVWMKKEETSLKRSGSKRVQNRIAAHIPRRFSMKSRFWGYVYLAIKIRCQYTNFEANER